MQECLSGFHFASPERRTDAGCEHNADKDRHLDRVDVAQRFIAEVVREKPIKSPSDGENCRTDTYANPPLFPYVSAQFIILEEGIADRCEGIGKSDSDESQADGWCASVDARRDSCDQTDHSNANRNPNLNGRWIEFGSPDWLEYRTPLGILGPLGLRSMNHNFLRFVGDRDRLLALRTWALLPSVLVTDRESSEATGAGYWDRHSRNSLEKRAEFRVAL